MIHREIDFDVSKPRTPPHTQADQEMDINEINELSGEELLELELNPDLEHATKTLFKDQLKEGKLHKRIFSDISTEHDNFYDSRGDFEPQINMLSPFVSKDTNQGIENENRPQTHRRLSLSQQSKFILYCDEQLMQIQRKVVQSMSLNNESGYLSLDELIIDLKKSIDFIWFSLDGVSNTEQLIGQDLDVLREKFSHTKSTNFGQTHYLIKIADDFMDYLNKFSLVTLDESERLEILTKIFKFLAILDKIFARLIDGSVPGQIKMTGTDMVRISGITERIRFMLPNYFEKQGVNGYRYEQSKIFEETLDRMR